MSGDAPSAVSRAARRFAEGLAVACMGGLLLLAAATTVDVVLRYAFARPIRGFVDVASLAGAVLLAGCMPHVLASRSNIAVDALGRRLGGRARRALDAFAATVTAAFFAVMAWQYLGFAMELRETAQRIPVLRWPVWPWWAAVAAAITIAAAVGLATLADRPAGDDAR